MFVCKCLFVSFFRFLSLGLATEKMVTKKKKTKTKTKMPITFETEEEDGDN